MKTLQNSPFAMTGLLLLMLAGCGGGGDGVTSTAASSNASSAAAVVSSSSSSSGASSSASSASSSSAGGTSTAAAYCGYNNSVLNAALGLTSSVNINCACGQRVMTGNGVPDHVTGTFPNSGNPNRITAQTVQFTAALAPVATTTATSVMIAGVANNSVKFDPGTAESYQNAGVWRIEALNQTYFAFGVDSSNAHVQPNGAYHYHGMPEAYMATLNKGTAMTLVGFAADGFPVYARYGYNVATDAGSGVRVIRASWRMKTSPDAGRPATSLVPMGTFVQDYEYVAGLGDLDECNGRTGVTPEFPGGIYHYYITDGYPYIQRCTKGR